jgi:hypothetical protein
MVKFKGEDGQWHDIDELAADAQQLPDETALGTLSKLVLAHLELEREIAQKQFELGVRMEELRIINEVKIPEIFHAMGLEKFKLANGAEVEVKKFYAASITAENEAGCFNWLKEKGYDDIIKNELKLTFGKGEDEACVQLAEALEAQGYNFMNKKSVHSSTLKAFVKEHCEAGDAEFPRDLFSVFVGDKTKIKLKGGKKHE